MENNNNIFAGSSMENQNQNEKGNVKMENKKVLANGITYYGKLDTVDLLEAQHILNQGSYTENFSAIDAYMERVDNNFEGTYSVKVEREKDYKRFLRMLEEDKCSEMKQVETERHDFMMAVRHGYLMNRIDFDDYENYTKILTDVYFDKEESHDCKQCKFRQPSFIEWKENRYFKNGNAGKFSKALSKAGFSKELIDFYTTSIRDEKEVFITITGNPQFIAGMTYYHSQGWNSCQNPENNAEYSVHLAGALHDNKLFVAMLHDEIEDLQDMKGKLLARSNMRYIEIDNEPLLVATSFYGQNKDAGMLDAGLKKMNGLDIFSDNVVGDGDYVTESASGYYEGEIEKEINVYYNEWHTMTVECPVCDGTGEYCAEDDCGTEHEIECPNCEGTGEHEAEERIQFDTQVIVSSYEDSIEPYCESYVHCGSYIEICINHNIVHDARMERKRMEQAYEMNEEYSRESKRLNKLLVNDMNEDMDMPSKELVLQQVAEIEERYIIEEYSGHDEIEDDISITPLDVSEYMNGNN